MTSIFSSNFLLAVWMKTNLLAQVTSETETTTSPAPTISPIFMIIWLAVVVLMIASMWKIFTKAGQPGWASLIPIYKHIRLVQDRGSTRLVGDFVFHSIRQFRD